MKLSFHALRCAPGFSLIKLLVVIAIISILAAIGTPRLMEAETRSRLARTRVDMLAICTALQSYSADYNGKYPPAPYDDPAFGPPYLASQEFSMNGGFGLTTPQAYLVSVPVATYLSAFPATPKVPGAGYFLFNYQFHTHLNGSLPESQRCPFAEDFTGDSEVWALWSLGPTLGNPASDFGVVYDPTNGAESRGRVVLFNSRKGRPDIYRING